MFAAHHNFFYLTTWRNAMKITRALYSANFLHLPLSSSHIDARTFYIHHRAIFWVLHSEHRPHDDLKSHIATDFLHLGNKKVSNLWRRWSLGSLSACCHLANKQLCLLPLLVHQLPLQPTALWWVKGWCPLLQLSPVLFVIKLLFSYKEWK
jgi:hypothetical protein